MMGSMDIRPHRLTKPGIGFDAVLKFLIMFEQQVPHFDFALGPANQVVGPAEHPLVVGAESGLNFTKCARSQILLCHPPVIKFCALINTQTGLTTSRACSF